MKENYHFFAKKPTALRLFCLLIMLQGGCVHHAMFLGQRGGKVPPRIRIACYASATIGTAFVDPDNLGTHGYLNGLGEANGIIYTCKAGHIDIAHVRKAADYTMYLAENTRQQIEKNKTKFSFKFKEPSRYYVQLTYPENWDDLPEAEKDAIAHDLSIKLGQYFAHIGTAWHEILTWFGYRSVILYPEFPSAFSWEDSFSNVLGTHLGSQALRDTEHSYDEAMTLAIDHELEKLVVQPKRVAMRASEKVKGTWSTGEFLFLVDIKKRNLDIGLDDGFVTPWLVPSLAECDQAEAQSYPAPNLDCLGEYGFSMKLEIEPRELEKKRILNILYPDKKTRKKRLEPAVHFAPIMDYIKQDAIKRYGPDTDTQDTTLD